MPKDLMGSKRNRRGTQQAAKQTGVQEADIRKMMGALKGKSPQQMQQELFETARRQMESGQFNPQQIQSFMQSVSPMLDTQQRRKMQELVQKMQHLDD